MTSHPSSVVDATSSVTTEDPVSEPSAMEEPKGSVDISDQREVIPLEVSLQASLSKGKESMELRSVQSKELQTQLTRSVARRKEIEDVIVSELTVLAGKLREEDEQEKMRLADLKLLFQRLSEAMTTKRDLVKAEVAIKEEMQDVQRKVSESAILAQLNSAIEKKASLVSIEENIIVDIEATKEEVAIEIDSTEEKLKRLQKVIQVFTIFKKRQILFSNKFAISTNSRACRVMETAMSQCSTHGNRLKRYNVPWLIQLKTPLRGVPK